MTKVSWMSPDYPIIPYVGPPRYVAYIEHLSFDPDLQPKHCEISGTDPASKILILDVDILDATGREPYRGDVLITGQRFSHVGIVPDKELLLEDASVRILHGKGRTLMPGMGDAHTHFTWNGGDLYQLAELGVEEHTLVTARSGGCCLDSGYTMCFGAASAKRRLDVVIRDAINAGDIPGPRFLANGQGIARRGGELVGGITAFADGPEEMRQVCYEAPDGCPNSDFLHPAGTCKERIQILGGYNCCCGCPGEVTEYHHCVIEFIAGYPFNYGTPGNIVGFCQDENFFTRYHAELYTKQRCQEAQIAIAVKMSKFYREKSGGAAKFFTPLEYGGKVKTYPAGNKAWVYKIREGIEKIDKFSNITAACQDPEGKGLVPAQCALEKNNGCQGLMGTRFHASTKLGYMPEHGVETPTWPGSGF